MTNDNTKSGDERDEAVLSFLEKDGQTHHSTRARIVHLNTMHPANVFMSPLPSLQLHPDPPTVESTRLPPLQTATQSYS